MAAASNPTIYYAKYDGDDPIGDGWTEIVYNLKVLDMKLQQNDQKLIQVNDYVMIVNNRQKQILIFRITQVQRMPRTSQIINIYVNTTGGNYKAIDMRGVPFSTIMERINRVYEELRIEVTVHLNENDELTITEGQPYFGLPYFNIIGGKRRRRTNKRSKRRQIRTNKRRRRY
jgi:hypothetical protein